MDTKKCSKCGEVKSVEEFRHDNRNVSGFKSQCRQCEREYAKEYREKYPKKFKESKLKYRSSEKGKQKEKEWVKNNPEKIRITKRKNRHKNRDNINSYKRNYRLENLDKVRNKDKEYYNNNKEKINKRAKDRREDNPNYYKELNLRTKERMKVNNVFKIKENLRKNIYKWITRCGYNKITNTQLSIGCTYDEFIARAEELFLPDMSWDNYGEVWDFDHIIPICYAMTEEEVMMLNHYTNLKPMYSNENRYVKKNNVFYNEYDLYYVLNEWI